MEANEFPDPQQLGMISRGSGVQSLNDGRNISKD